jgi:hypothetical protein
MFVYLLRTIINNCFKNCKSSSEAITTAPSPRKEKKATTSAEPSPNKYNLMEETYGRKWSESPANMHLFSTDCTIGTIILRLQGYSKDKYVSFMTELLRNSFFHFRVRQCKSVAAGSPVCY